MMNWEAIGAIGEILGAGAVVLTLIYLSVQLRQNTKALRSNSWQAVQDSEQRFDTMLAGDLRLAHLWVRGSSQGISSIDDPAERFQFTLVAKQLVDLFQTHHYQHELGLIDDELWQTWVTQYVEETQRSPGLCDVINERYPHLRPSFRSFVDQHR